MSYQPVIGLEVHVELKTKSKMFCGCSADYFGKEPNTHTCPVCLGMPGALPVPNEKAIEWCVMIGQALGCEIPLFSKFDRKNYFYPDLPKGYQISQYDQPFCVNGRIAISNKQKEIRIRRVHMEEDTGKLVHSGDSTLIDFNRSGVPLVEIVTEPDFESAEEVVEYLKKLQQIVRYLDVSNADMEKGDMRLEPNISLMMSDEGLRINNKLPDYKVEVKNINSFRFVDKAIQFEIARQTELLEKGEKPAQETMGWDSKKQRTVPQRSKEEAHDYRYFAEPDIPPIRWAEEEVRSLKNKMPELPDEKLERFKKEYGLSEYDAEILTREKTTADYFEEALKVGIPKEIKAKQIANWIINKKVDVEKVLPAEIIKNIKSATQTVTLDENKLDEVIKQVLDENKKAVEDFKKGRENAIMYLLGQVMKSMKEKVDTQIVKTKIEQAIKEQ